MFLTQSCCLLLLNFCTWALYVLALATVRNDKTNGLMSELWTPQLSSLRGVTPLSFKTQSQFFKPALYSPPEVPAPSFHSATLHIGFHKESVNKRQGLGISYAVSFRPLGLTRFHTVDESCILSREELVRSPEIHELFTAPDLSNSFCWLNILGMAYSSNRLPLYNVFKVDIKKVFCHR